MSRFHQLSDGNSGRGTAGAAPSTGTDAGHCASDAGAARKANAIANDMCASLERMGAKPFGSNDRNMPLSYYAQQQNDARKIEKRSPMQSAHASDTGTRFS